MDPEAMVASPIREEPHDLFAEQDPPPPPSPPPGDPGDPGPPPEEVSDRIRRMVEHGYIAKVIPPSAIPAFQRGCRRVLSTIAREGEKAGVEGEYENKVLDEAIVQFMLIPGQLLKLGSRSGRRAVAKAVKESVDRYLDPRRAAEHKADVRSNAVERMEPAEDLDAKIDNDSKARADRRAKQASNLVLQHGKLNNVLSRAASRLVGNEAANVNHPEVLEALMRQVPGPEEELPTAPEMVGGGNRVLITEEEITKVLKVMARRSSGAGPSGWTDCLLGELHSDPDCVRGLTVLANLIANDKVSDAVWPFLTGQCLYALYKTRVASRGDPIRPIDCGEAVVKLVCRVVLAKLGDHFDALFAGVQLALSKGGSEKAVHTIQALLETNLQEHEGDLSKNTVALFTDISNAFGTINRAEMMKTIFAEDRLQPAWSLTSFLYKKPSREYVTSQGKVIATRQSENGVRPGCAFSPFAFAMGIGSTLLESKRSDAAGGKVDVVAILDDVTLTGAAEQVLDTFKRELKPRLEAQNMHVNMNKTKLLWPYRNREVPAELQSQCDELGLEVVKNNAVVLGTLVGLINETEADKFVEGKIKDHDDFFNALVNPHMSKTVAALLLNFCAQPRMNYVFRTLPSVLYPAQVAEWEKKCAEVARHVYSCNVAINRRSLRISQGGFGIDDAQAVAPVAYFASAQLANGVWLEADRRGVHVQKCSVQMRLRVCFDLVANLGVPRGMVGVLPFRSTDKQFAFFGTHVTSLQQRILNFVMIKKRNDLEADIRARGNVVEMAHLHAVRAQHSGSMLTMIPSLELGLNMSDSELETLARNRAFLPASDDLPMPGRCVLCDADITNHPSHYLSCRHMKGEATSRHHLVVRNAVLGCLRAVGMHARAEPAELLVGEGVCVDGVRGDLRPDLYVGMEDGASLLDAFVVDPCASTSIPKALLGTLKHAEDYAQKKRLKYGAACDRRHWRFVPFGLEAYGGICKDAIKFLGDLAKESVVFDPSSFKYELIRRVALQIVRGNDHMRRQWITKSIMKFDRDNGAIGGRARPRGAPRRRPRSAAVAAAVERRVVQNVADLIVSGQL
jgi:hypothetical protein